MTGRQSEPVSLPERGHIRRYLVDTLLNLLSQLLNVAERRANGQGLPPLAGISSKLFHTVTLFLYLNYNFTHK